MKSFAADIGIVRKVLEIEIARMRSKRTDFRLSVADSLLAEVARIEQSMLGAYGTPGDGATGK